MTESIKPWSTDISGEKVKLFPDERVLEEHAKRYKKAYKLGVVVVSFFRYAQEQDYIKSFFDMEDGHREIVAYDQRELAIWLAGVGATDEDSRILRLANRERGSFVDQHGWNPLFMLKDLPTPGEEETWINYNSSLIDEDWEHLFDDDGDA